MKSFVLGRSTGKTAHSITRACTMTGTNMAMERVLKILSVTCTKFVGQLN